jgi:glycosyltransferase involved in cell wall biosynthesis
VDVLLPHHPRLRRPPGEPVRFFAYRYAPFEAWSVWGYAQSLAADVRVKGGAFLLAPLVAAALRAALSTRLLAERYDVVHAHWLVPNAAMVRDVVRAHHVPLVVSLHGSDVFVAERLAPARRLARAAFHASGAITACSRDLHERALRLGAHPARTRTLPYGVDVSAFSAPLRPHLREGLGVMPGEFLVLGFGRLVEKKGFRYLIEAAARVPGVRVVIAGDGDLRAELAALGHSSRAPVRFAGALDRDAMAALLQVADAVVVPSVVDRAGNVDGLPNALLEALAAGRPVIASRVAGIPDVVSDGEHGLLVDPKDVKGIASALSRLRDDKALGGRLGRAARERVSTSYSWDAAARAFEECYRQARRHAA